MLDIGAKKRLIGAVVLVVLAVVFLPMLVKEGPDHEPVSEGDFAMPAKPPVDRGHQAEVFPTLQETRPRAMDAGTAPGMSAAPPGGAGGLSADELDAVAPGTHAQPVAVAKPSKPEPPKSEPTKPEPPKPEPPKTTAKSDPTKTVATKPEPKADPVKAKTPETAPKPAPRPVAKGLGSWVVQVAALSTPEAAQKLEKELRGKGYAAFVQKLEGSNRTLWRVRVGPEVDHDRAKSMADEIKRHTGLPDVNIQKYRDG